MGQLKKIRAKFYATSAGDEPVRSWLRDLTKEDRRIIGEDIQTVEFGWPLGLPVCRSLGQRLWEIRSQISGGRTARTLFYVDGDKMVLLHIFVKKTQKTPDKDLRLALDRLRTYLRGKR